MAAGSQTGAQGSINMTNAKTWLAALSLVLLVGACANPAPQETAATPPAPAAAPVRTVSAPPTTNASIPQASNPVAQQIEAMKLDIPYTKYVLNNGLTLIVAPDARTPTVTFHIWYHVG